MKYKYWLPDGNGKKDERETDQNAVIIIGANGSGKSKLGAWIEQQNFDEVHRVGAQRKLNFQENLPLKSYQEAENMVFYGAPKRSTNKKAQRWNWEHYTTHLIDDYDNVLAALIALKNNEISAFTDACKQAGPDKMKWPDAPRTSIDKLQDIWNIVMPQRRIVEEDARFYAKFGNGDVEQKYSATEMSDGERSVLYLAAQVLCVPDNKIIIIDEPELHLHRSIMNRLWKTLESFRPDCLFIYITHDLQFVSAHGNVDKIWIKNFDGNKWEFEEIREENLPEDLTLEIFGSRRNILFVEGEKHSFDYQLYAQLYPDYLIVPCGGCSQVIMRTKAFLNSSYLHDYKVYGLIDRDFRSEHEIAALKNNKIFVLEVAEVENLFLVEELIRIMALQLGVSDPEQAVQKVKDFVIDTKLGNMCNQQICQSVVAEIKYLLSCIEINGKKETEVNDCFDSEIKKIAIEEIKKQKETLFQQVRDEKDYKNVLKVFNEKGLAASIGHLLGVNNNEYQKKVITLLEGICHDEITKALAQYLPREIPRENNLCSGNQ